MSDILCQLRDHRSLSSTEVKIAEYICAHSQEVTTMSVREIARKTYASPTSVMRLCRKICEDGFAQFRIQLACELQKYQHHEIMPSQENLSQKMESIDQIEEHLEKNMIESIRYTKQLIDSDMIDQVVHLMKKSCVIDIYGRGASYLVGLDFRYKLCRLGYQVQMNESIDLQTIQAIHSSSDHCALIISSSGETPELLNFAQILNHKGAPLITLTSTKDCSLLKYSDYSLFFKCFETNQRVGGITSRSAMQYVCDVIYFTLFNTDYKKNTQAVIDSYVPSDIAYYDK